MPNRLTAKAANIRALFFLQQHQRLLASESIPASRKWGQLAELSDKLKKLAPDCTEDVREICLNAYEVGWIYIRETASEKAGLSPFSTEED